MGVNSKNINYPYLPEGREYLYVEADNPFMLKAKEVAQSESLDFVMPTASVIVKNGEIVSTGANGSDYHKHNECERVKQNIPTGTGYELCEGCHPKNHSEQRAIKNTNDVDLNNADLYLWGHWWCCESCWGHMQKAGIKNVYLLENSEVLFNKNTEGNMVGKQKEM